MTPPRRRGKGNPAGGDARGSRRGSSVLYGDHLVLPVRLEIPLEVAEALLVHERDAQLDVGISEVRAPLEAHVGDVEFLVLKPLDSRLDAARLPPPPHGHV